MFDVRACTMTAFSRQVKLGDRLRSSSYQEVFSPAFLPLFQLKRAGVELIVFAAFGDQLFVATALDDDAMVKHHNDVRIADSRQAVRDDEDGSALHQRIHAGLYNGLGTGVDGGGRLVHDHNGRISHRCARDRQQLNLSHRRYRHDRYDRPVR